MKITTIIVGAGKGKRMGSRAKAFLNLAGSPLLLHSIKPFERSSLVNEIVLVVGKDRIKQTENLMAKHQIKKVIKVIEGGQERQDSVYNALEIIDNTDIVLVHDVARPFIDTKLIKDCVDAAKKYKAAIPAVPVRDTIKKGETFVEKTIPRNNLWLVQTPQAFDFKLLKRAYEKASKDGYLGTDDASLVENLGERIKIVRGYWDNIKITYPSDISLGEFLAKEGKRE